MAGEKYLSFKQDVKDDENSSQIIIDVTYY